MQRIDLCGQPFKGLRERGMYYVDKSLLIKELLDSNDRGVFLFTRPRRFGKTTNLSMLDAFFNIRYAGNPWFDDLEISRYPEYTGYKNKFPVIHLNLNDTKANTYGSYINKLRIAVKDAYEPHRYLLEDDDLDTAVRDNFDSFARRNISEDFLSTSIKDLSDAISRINRRPIILIDEYDRAVTDNFGKKSQKDILDFLGDFLCSALKTNANREMAYMTGIMQIAQTSSFSGLNNVSVHNIFSEMGDERFGFTGSEVERILKDFGHTEKMGEAKEWYDGYRFGNAEVYNPFSIMSYVSHGFKPEQYWIDSGSTSMITDLLWNVDSQNFEKVVDLVTGGRVETRLDHMLTYGRIMNKDDHLFSLMALSGYLRAVPIGDGRYETSIPNNEVRMAVENLTSSVFPVDTGYFGQFVRATIDGDAASMEETFQDILLHGNCLNLKENAYEVIMMTLMHSLVKRYNVRTEHKSGFGRTDIVLEPRNDGDQYRIFELKVSRSADRLESDAKEAIEQIHRERYHLGMPGEVVLYGISFYGNTLKVLIEKVQDGRDNNLR